MIPLPEPEDYDVSVVNGFLPTQPPLQQLPDPYFEPWENIVKNLQGLILSKRLHEVVDKLPVLSTHRLAGEAQWRRAYCALAFIVHAYVWGGKKPSERVPPPITIPFKVICKRLELPLVATYAGVALWNWKPIFDSERSNTLANLDTINTFTGSLDEKWFYLISIAIESKAGPIVPLMLKAIDAANKNDGTVVTRCLQAFAERLDDLGAMLSQMYDNCDPHVFYHRIRPYLAGSKNMAQAGLPNGVIFDDGGPMHKQRYVQFSGGSNAQSSIIQFFDIVLDVQHRPAKSKGSDAGVSKAKPTELSFIHEMRRYMPGPHARFLEKVTQVANIRAFVHQQSYDPVLVLAYDACLAMLSSFRDKHIQIVSRYIVIQSIEAKKRENSQKKDKKEDELQQTLATRTKPTADLDAKKAELRGTGGTSLISFLRQARNETGEPAVSAWTRALLNRRAG